MTSAPSQTALQIPTTGVAAGLLGRSGWRVVLVVWAAYALYQGLAYGGGAIERMSSDDAMRLAELKDLLAGQGWFDLTQRRLNPPGVLMHWSRLIDLPIALLLRLMELVLPAEAAMRATVTIWPSLLMLAAMLACATAAAAVGGPLAGAVSSVMFLLSPGLLVQFGPGTIDHHGAQMALMLTMLAGVMLIGSSARAGMIAGFAAAAMTAIGMETAPHVVAGAGFVALRWAIQGAPVARGARGVGLAFGAGTALVAVSTTPFSTWAAPLCDALGAGHIAAAAIGGFGLAAIASSVLDRKARFAAIIAVGLAAIAAIAIVAPNCLSQPYGDLPERLKTEWLDHVQEAHSFVASARSEPMAAFAIGAAMLGAIAAAVFALLNVLGEARWRAAAAVAMLVASCAVTLWQIRGASLAFASAATLLPAAAVAIGRTGGWARLALAVGGLSPATLAASGLGIAMLIGMPPLDPRAVTRGLCPVADYRALARIQPLGLALNTIYSGPFLLAHTGLSAVAGPYHRDVDGIAASIDAFGGSDETARAIAMSRGAALVVVCESDQNLKRAIAHNPDGFTAKLFSGQTPAWLQRIDLGPNAELRAWRVVGGG